MVPAVLEVPELIERGGLADRAFADAVLRLDWARTREPSERAELAALHVRLRAAALRAHAALRGEIAAGRQRGAALRRVFDAAPPPERDHFVEEALGIAYPPLDEPTLSTSGLMTYSPSGYAEIVHALDVTRLAPGDCFMDLGAGLGKAVMLATLLSGASSIGIELDGALCELGSAACEELRLADVRLLQGDARHARSVDVDVLFMYLPFAGDVLASVMERLLADAEQARERGRRRFLCTAPLDLQRYRALEPAGPTLSWLAIYAFR